MKSLTVFDTLATLNAQQTDAAAQALGMAVTQRDDAQQRLAMLQQLRTEYENKLQEKMKTGLPFAAYRNFQTFLIKIDDAIRGQQKMTADAVERSKRTLSQWQDKKREGMTWEVLARRADDAARTKAARRERTLNDEFAARAVIRAKETR